MRLQAATAEHAQLLNTSLDDARQRPGGEAVAEITGILGRPAATH